VETHEPQPGDAPPTTAVTPGERLRWRLIAAAGVRLCGLVLALVAVSQFLSWVGQGIADDDLFELTYYIGNIVLGVLAGAAALACLALARPIGVFLVRAPEGPVCPRCWFSLKGLAPAVCPECGLALTETHARPATGWIMGAMVLIRLLGLGMSLYAIHITAIWLFYSVTMGGQFLGAGSMTSWSGALSWLLPLAPVPIGAALWVFAPRLARWTCAGLRP
jgi:hypothetical protein